MLGCAMFPVKTVKKQVGRFQKGRSGNPNGRPKGSRNVATLACEALLDGQAEALTQKAIQMALAGDPVALGSVLTEYTLLAKIDRWHSRCRRLTAPGTPLTSWPQLRERWQTAISPRAKRAKLPR